MKVLIENYRGFEISFDTDEEVFCLFSDTWNNQNVKKSFASAKSYVDGFIKENNEFKPVVIINCHGVKKTLIGIRKDGRFVYEKEGKKEQLSEHDERDWILYNHETHDEFISELQKLSEIKDRAHKAYYDKMKEFKGVSLKEIKSQYIK